MVPAIIITSAWRGVARATSKPKREKSYFEEATDIISIPQQLVAKVSGHKELERAQLTMSLKELMRMPPPGRSSAWPGNGSFPWDAVSISLFTLLSIRYLS